MPLHGRVHDRQYGRKESGLSLISGKGKAYNAGMKNVFYACAALAGALCMAPAHADEAAMKKALEGWEQQMTEFQAAKKVAKTEGQRAALKFPDGYDVAKKLWKAVNRRTGEREEMVRPSAAERMKGATDQKKDIPTYEFEEPWAAPAVAWFINHPQAFAQIFGDKQRQVSYYANAMLESVARVHYNHPAIAEACAKMSESSSVRVYEMLEKIYSRNQDPTARANAALALSIMLGNPAVSSAEGSDAMARSKRVYYLKQALNLAPEEAMFGDMSLSEAGLEVAYILRHLTVGSIPPQMTLSDGQGKQVSFPVPGKANLLFFWSPAEPNGLRLVSKSEQIHQQYPELEFCPITSYSDTEEWKATLQEQGIPFSYMDDEQGTAGKAYRITQLPTAVLVNDKCQILYIGYPGLQLQTALDNLFSDKTAQRKRVTIGEEAPAIQPGSQPEPAGPQQPAAAPANTPLPASSNEAPELRDMPEF